jgi:Mycobacterial 4 TMS phage holin, superfamily IV
MLIRLLIRLVVLAAIIDVVARIVPGVHVHGGFLWLLWVALIFSVVNLILGPLFKLLSLPFILVTLSSRCSARWLNCCCPCSGARSVPRAGLLLRILPERARPPTRHCPRLATENKTREREVITVDHDPTRSSAVAA